MTNSHRALWIPISLGAVVLLVLIGGAVTFGIVIGRGEHKPASEVSTLEWTEVRGVWLPVSDQDGPSDRADGRARGFARTERGAVLAAVNLVARADASLGPSVFRPTLAEQVVGPSAATLSEAVEADYARRRIEGGIADGAPLPVRSEFVGYRVDAFDRDSATVQVISKADDVTVGFSAEVRWDAGDWKLVAPQGGTWNGSVQVLDDDAAFEKFPPR